MKKISSLEEAIYRMTKGYNVRKDLVLEKKTNNPDLLSLLEKIEKELFEQSLKRKKIAKNKNN